MEQSIGQAIIESNARQSAFYAANDPSIEATPICGDDYPHPADQVWTDSDGLTLCDACGYPVELA